MKKPAALLLALLLLLSAVPAFAELAVGDRIALGHYEQDNNAKNGKEEILWDVVETNGGEATLLSVHILDWRVFHTNSRCKSWEAGALRKWLNSSFVNGAFSKPEAAVLLKKEISNAASEASNHYCKGGRTTKDRVVIPTYAECVRFFGEPGTGEQWKAQPTLFAVKNKAKLEKEQAKLEGDGGYAGWWLRSCLDMGFWGYYAEAVESSGIVKPNSSKLVRTNLGIRPMITVSVEKYEKYLETLG